MLEAVVVVAAAAAVVVVVVYLVLVPCLALTKLFAVFAVLAADCLYSHVMQLVFLTEV